MRRNWLALAAAASFRLRQVSMALLLVALAIGSARHRGAAHLRDAVVPDRCGDRCDHHPANLWVASRARLALLRGTPGRRGASPRFQQRLAARITKPRRQRDLLRKPNSWCTPNPLAARSGSAGSIAPFTWTPAPATMDFDRVRRALRRGGCARSQGLLHHWMYGALLAIGSVVVERSALWLRSVFFVALTATAIATMPLHFRFCRSTGSLPIRKGSDLPGATARLRGSFSRFMPKNLVRIGSRATSPRCMTGFRIDAGEHRDLRGPYADAGAIRLLWSGGRPSAAPLAVRTHIGFGEPMATTEKA